MINLRLILYLVFAYTPPIALKAFKCTAVCSTNHRLWFAIHSLLLPFFMSLKSNPVHAS